MSIARSPSRSNVLAGTLRGGGDYASLMIFQINPEFVTVAPAK